MPTLTTPLDRSTRAERRLRPSNEPLLATIRPRQTEVESQGWLEVFADIRKAWWVLTSPRQVEKLLQGEYPCDEDLGDGLSFALAVFLLFFLCATTILGIWDLRVGPIEAIMSNNTRYAVADNGSNFHHEWRPIVDDIGHIQEFFVCIFAIFGVLTGVYALRRPGFKALVNFRSDMARMRVHSLVGISRAEPDDPSGGLRTRVSFVGRWLFRWLCFSPVIWPIAVGVYIHGEGQVPPGPSELVSNFLAWSQNPREAFVMVVQVAIAAQVISGTAVLGEIYEQACKNSIRAIVNELNIESMASLHCEEGDHDKDLLALVLTHVMRFGQDMFDFWALWEGGMPTCCLLSIAFIYVFDSGLNVVIQTNSGMDASFNVFLFFFGLAILVWMLYFLASITAQCTSTDPYSNSIVAATRHYVRLRLSRDMLSGSEHLEMSPAERQELLTTGAMIESRCLGVQLMGTITVSYALVMTTALRLGVYLPGAYAFVTNFVVLRSS